MLKPLNKFELDSSSQNLSGDIFEMLENIVSANELWDVLHQFLLSKGFESLAYYHMPPAGARDYDSHFFATRGKNHQTVAAFKAALFDAKKTFIHTAKKCNNITLFTSSSTFDFLNSEQSNLFKTLHMSDCQQGLVIPVHGAKGRSGCFVLESKTRDEPLSTTDIRNLNWVMQTAHVSYCKIRRLESKSIKQLTAREKQILTWVARGKSNSVIADIIGISQHTVNGYLRSIYLKTGTSDRTTAAMRGIGESLIDI